MSATGQGGWMTVPEWAGVRQVEVFRREQDDSPMPETGAPRNFHVLVRGQVELPPGDYTIRISADDYYHAWLDGAWLGQGPAPAYHDRYFYQEYAVAGGRTVTVALHLYYQGLVNRVWNSGDGRFGLWAELVRDGEAVARCNGSWRYQVCSAYSGETTGYDTQFLEDFDSRRWPEGWERPGFDDGGWGRLIPADWADYELSPQPTANLSRTRVEPVASRAVPGGVLLDFGRERVGVLHAAAQGRAGQRLTLRFGEELDENGRVRYQMRCNCRYEEVWTLGPGESVLHQYDYKAFRYVEVLGLGDDRLLTGCWVWERHYPMDDGLCTLSCKRDELENIFTICKNAVRCGCQEGYLDCPSREKGQYLGDAVITARSQVWLTGKTDLLRKCVRDFMASARVTPALMGVAPGSLMQEIADFSLLFPALPLTDYDFTGDRDFLGECYPAVEGIVRYFAGYQRPDGLLENVSHGWNLVDWPENLRDGYDFPLTRPVVGEGCHNVINALWYACLLMKERMERALDLPMTGESRRVGAAFRDAFWRPEQNLFADSEKSAHCSLHANLYAACFGLTPPGGADAYEKLLLTPGRVCGVFPMYFALRGLGRLGRTDALYRLLTREDEYGWRNMLREGATACFEAWGKDQKWNTSLCHPWASGAVPLIIEELAGLRPDRSAEEGFRFEPHLPGKVDRFTLQAPLNGRLLRVKQKDGRRLLTVLPTHEKGE